MIHNNYLKDRLHQNLVGTHISMTDSIVSEMEGRLGYDFIWIDTEHSEISYTNLRNHITAVNAGGTPAIVRVSMNDYNHVKRVMEMGPDGIIFPMINTAEQAQAAAAIFAEVCPEVEVNVINGGQPVYYYLISAE